MAHKHDSWFTIIPSPVGVAFVAWSEQGISLITDAPDATTFVKMFQARFHRPLYLADESPEWLTVAFAANWGKEAQTIAAPEPRFDLAGLTEFEQAVLRKTAEIPCGEIRPYSWIAREIGRPKAVRAAGTALAHNPIPLLIPCHRVVRKDGHIGNFGLGGSQAKRALLAAEGIDLAQVEALARSGIRYWGNDATQTYCFPTCHQARQTTDNHRVSFHSDEEAIAVGYQPCPACRPGSGAVDRHTVAG